MISRNEIIIFILCFNIFCCFIRFDINSGKEESPQEPRKIITTFEELDRVMSNSEFSKAWKNFKSKAYNIKQEEGYEEIEEDPDLKMEYESFAQTDNAPDDDIKDSCLLSEEETKQKLKEAGITDGVITKDVRFIYGNCNPVLMIPGMLSTKLQVRINCKRMYNDEINIYKTMRFYCGDVICRDTEVTNENQNLFIVGLGNFTLVEIFGLNKYAGCLGYFLTFFNSKKACAPYKEGGEDDYVCNYSDNIRIGYYGYSTEDEQEGQCGLKAIRDVIMAGDLGGFVNTGVSKSLGPLIDRLKKKGYSPGFSLGGIPNDYRQFLIKNNFTIEALHHQIEKFYNNTGKPVILIGHSHGTITLYNSLVHKRNKNILYKIKKFVAVGPPFAGSSELIDVFFNDENKYRATININPTTSITAGFDQFGFGFIINKLATAVELRPLPIIGDLFTKPGYEIFADAIKERFFLEKKCGHTKCDDYIIKKYSQKFNALFKDYFPLLTDDDCKFEDSLEERKDVYNRKCLMEMRNMFECPMVIEESRDKNGNLPDDFDAYCGQYDDNLFYQKSCDNSHKQCLDQVYSKHIKYIYTKSNEKLQFFINRWENDYQSTYGECDASFYPEEKKYKASPQKEIDLFNKISIIKDMPTPTVDTDIVYSTFSPSVGAYIFDKEDWGKNYLRYYQGGDGIVPNWSPIIPGLKWIYDTKKYNLKTKIRLVEFCSRLAKDSKYKYDPNNPDQKFAAISCNCIDSNSNSYIGTNCGHGLMIQDPVFFDYIDTIVFDSKNAGPELDNNKKNAYQNYNNNTEYEQDCNFELLNILYNSMGNETSYE